MREKFNLGYEINSNITKPDILLYWLSIISGFAAFTIPIANFDLTLTYKWIVPAVLSFGFFVKLPYLYTRAFLSFWNCLVLSAGWGILAIIQRK